jgi:hypothetical protein
MESEAEARRARLLALRNQAASAAASKSANSATEAPIARPPQFQQPFVASTGPTSAAPVGFYSSMHLPSPANTSAGPKPHLFQKNYIAASSDQYKHMMTPQAPQPFGGGRGLPPNPMAQRAPPPFYPMSTTGQSMAQQQQAPPGIPQGFVQGGHLGRGSGPPFNGHGGGARGGRGGGNFGGRGGGRGGHQQHTGGGGGSYYKSSFMEDPWAALVAASECKPPKLPRTM